jgi:UDP-glucuronate 4-epimerase
VNRAAQRVLLTGAAGFIGFHLAVRLLRDGHEVLGIDDLNGYYDPALKQARLARLLPEAGFRFERADMADHARIRALFEAFRPSEVFHLAAQAGVRHSLDDPRAYTRSNVDGFLSVLESCRHVPVRHLVYASSSSVYGANETVPFSEGDRVDRPVSLYAATKRANELMARSYSHLFGIPSTGIRFFTVYGPWGRPDMAYYGFTEAVFRGQDIVLFNDGRMSRDFTFIDDAVDALAALRGLPPAASGAEPPHALYNVGSGRPVELARFVELIARAAGRPARTVGRPMQPGDVVRTAADVSRLQARVGAAPATPIEAGLERFVAWFRAYHGVPA